MKTELRFGTRLLETTLREGPAGELAIEDLDSTERVPLRTTCWIDDGAADAFETALAEDGTVAEVTHVVSAGYGHQYAVVHPDDAGGVELYRAAVAHGGVFLSGRGRAGGWNLRMRFPDREAVAGFRESCADAGLDLSVRDVRADGEAPRADRYGVSDAQREALRLATERGYFAVPREVSLGEVAEELGVSSQAASERLRRGLDTLVDRTLVDPGS